MGMISADAALDGLLLGGGLEKGFADLADAQIGGEVIEGAVFLAGGADAVGLAAGGEAFGEGGAQEVRREAGLAQEGGLALAQGPGGGAAERVYLSHV